MGGEGEGEGEGEITVEPPWTLAVAARSDCQTWLSCFFKSSSWSNTRISHLSFLSLIQLFFFYLGK